MAGPRTIFAVHPSWWRRAVARSNLVRLGWRVICVRNAAEALRRAGEARPARALLPPMPASEAMAIRDRLKQYPPTTHTPLLMPANPLAFMGCLVGFGREAEWT